MLSTLLYFFLALLLLVVIHELGHFSVARLCGVQVLRFSFGFGKTLFSFKDKKGTEYVCGALPLGGYVKMLDEREGPVEPNQVAHAFNRQSVYKRIAIVLAGPVFNFIFAFFALWLVWVIGIESLAPIVNKVVPQSIAAKAGIKPQDEIVAINQKSVMSWRNVQYELIPYFGSSETISMRVKSGSPAQFRELKMPLATWEITPDGVDPLTALGIEPFLPKIPPVVGEILPDSPASRAHFQIGDKIVSLDGQKIQDWMEMVNYVRLHPETLIRVTIERQGKLLNLEVVSGRLASSTKAEGYFGMRSEKMTWPKALLRIERETPLVALNSAFWQTLRLSVTTFQLMGKLVTGQLGLDNVSGPVGIAKGAGESGRSGFVYYLSFLALVSISLGVINLLPIPLLDGGHLMYYVLEIVLRRPLSERVMSLANALGLVFLLAMMALALGNDLARLGSS